MLQYNDSNISGEDIAAVLWMYESGARLDTIKKGTKLPYNVIIHILTTNYMLDKNLREFVARKKIKEDEILVISDTHLGGRLENPDALDCVYEYAKKKGIHSVVHTGDLMHGTYNKIKKQYRDLAKQIEYIKKIYPQDNSIKTYILWGNHDFSLLKEDDEFMKALKERRDFIFLGYKRSYIDFNNQLLELSHPIEEYTLRIPDLKNLLLLSGHRHALKIKSNARIFIPTLSNHFLNVSNEGTKLPCFLDIYQTKENIIVKVKAIKDYKVTDEGEVLRKKLLR